MANIPIQPVIPPVINLGAQAIGNRFWLQMGYTYGRNDSGYFQNFNYKGIETDIETLAPIFDAAGWTWTVTPKTGGGLATLEAHAGFGGPSSVGTNYGTEIPENVWELDPNESDKGLLEADFPLSSTSGLNDINLSSYISAAINSSATKQAIANILNDPTAKWNPPAGATPGIVQANSLFYFFDNGANVADNNVNLPTADYAAAFSIYCFLKQDFTNFPIEASVIRHTQLVSNQYTVQASFTNVNRIISSASMVSIEDVPSGLLFSVPTTPSPSQFIETAGDLQYGWRKLRPNVTRLASYKWRIVQNWQLGLWPIRAFGSVL